MIYGKILLKYRLNAAVAAIVLILANSAVAGNETLPGMILSDYPTFTNISIDWLISGDDNENSTVTVRYREQGETMYREGLPLFRVPSGSNYGHTWANRHSGSIFGLEPGHTYEIELTLKDMDGGNAQEVITATTREYPAADPDGEKILVTPATVSQALDSAEPGDIIILQVGNYNGFSLDRDGTPGHPIVIRGVDGGGAVIQGRLTLSGRSWVYLEDLEIDGNIRINSTANIMIKGCRITTEDNGIASYSNGLTNGYIVGNVISGPTIWHEDALGASGDNRGEGIELTGPGSVIAFNRVSGFRDCISLLESDEAVNQVSIDIYGNDLSACADDGIEADYAMGNVRVYENRIVDSFMGISSQPGIGGPTYFIRNVMYNVIYEAFKLHNGTVGDVFLHNTVVKSGDAFGVYTDADVSRAYSRNNLFIGGPGGTYNGYNSHDGAVINIRSADETCSFDYDGFGSIGTGAFDGRIGDTYFASYSEMVGETTEENAVWVDYSIFAEPPVYPGDPFAMQTIPLLTLYEDGDAVDSGIFLPGINAGYSGGAPDLGAYEIGITPPRYGP